MLLTDADRKERIARIQQSMRSFPRALEPFLPLQQQFATRNNVDITRTCHATPLWHARAFLSENSWDRLTELGKADSRRRLLSPIPSSRLAGSTMKTSGPQAPLADGAS